MPPTAPNTPYARMSTNSQHTLFHITTAKVSRLRLLLGRHFFFLVYFFIVCLKLTRVDFFVDIRAFGAFGAAGGIRFFSERLRVSGSSSFENRVYRSFTQLFNRGSSQNPISCGLVRFRSQHYHSCYQNTGPLVLIAFKVCCALKELSELLTGSIISRFWFDSNL